MRGEGSRICVCALLLANPALAQDKIPVTLELVLALDSSASVDAREFQLQNEGIALAFRDAEVVKAIDNMKPFGAAIAVIQWGAKDETQVVLPFTHIENARDVKAFGFRVGLIRRWMRASATSIATGINDASALIESNGFEGQRKVIDISGDGVDNGGIDLDSARIQANRTGITVNGLAIESEDKKLTDYYEKQVIIGADAFVESAQGFEDFARAIKEKLLRELRPLGS
jgi:Protein of unknown function (DUF1194)